MSTLDLVKSVSSVTLTTILFPSILSTIPSLFATIVTPESSATSLSIPVPTREGPLVLTMELLVSSCLIPLKLC